MDDRGHVEHHHGGLRDLGHPHRVMGGLASGQEGMVARYQLLGLGITRRMIERRVENGYLHVIFPGVYAVGHSEVSRRGRWMAATLFGAPGASLGHRAAAASWGLRDHSPYVIDLTVPTRRRPHPGIRFHRERLPADEITFDGAIPVTTPARTCFDLAGVLEPHQLESAVNELEVRKLWGTLSLWDLLERHPRRAGGGALRAILEAGRMGTSRTRTEMEALFLGSLDEWRLPRPVTNTVIETAGGAFECDCVWRAERLVVELDGRGSHATARAFEEDRLRDRALMAAGWRPARVTWAQLHGDRPALARDVRALLAPSLARA